MTDAPVDLDNPLGWICDAEGDELSYAETQLLNTVAATAARFDAGEASMIGRDEDGHIVNGAMIAIRKTELVGIVFTYDEDPDDDEDSGRTQIKFAFAPIPEEAQL